MIMSIIYWILPKKILTHGKTMELLVANGQVMLGFMPNVERGKHGMVGPVDQMLEAWGMWISEYCTIHIFSPFQKKYFKLLFLTDFNFF